MNTPDKNKQDQKTQDFPGYPPYPASDDITNKDERIDYGTLRHPDKNDPANPAPEEKPLPVPPPQNSDAAFDPDTDVSPEEVEMLTAADQNRDMDDPDPEEPLLDTTDEDGDPLNEQQPSYGLEGADLDVPGSERDDGNEAIGEEDEENNYYSLGQDRQPDIENGENVTNR
jgi:hypothetical protein